MRVLGLDEAGRGSVLGPLVVGSFLYEGGGEDALRDAGADDSKALSPARRAVAHARLRALGSFDLVRIEPRQIDEGNVNELEFRAFLELVARARPDRVLLDAPVHPGGIPALRRRLVRESGVADWVVEPKADVRWATVGAASIHAKLDRDAAIAALGEVGSGYPSDPATLAWLRARLREGALPACVRTRWGTLDRLRQSELFPGAGG